MMSRLRLFSESISSLWLMLVTHWPGPPGNWLRYVYWKRRLKFLGKNVLLDTGIYFQNPKFIEIHDNCWIDRNVAILAGLDSSKRERIVKANKCYPGLPGVVHIGENVHVGPGCILSGISAGIYISDDCGISANSKFYAFSHHYRSKKSPADMNCHFGPQVSHERQTLIEGAIYIGKNTGIALNSVILPGASIPGNCFVALNSVVSGEAVEANSILSGNPAKCIGKRFRDH